MSIVRNEASSLAQPQHTDCSEHAVESIRCYIFLIRHLFLGAARVGSYGMISSSRIVPHSLGTFVSLSLFAVESFSLLLQCNSMQHSVDETAIVS